MADSKVVDVIRAHRLAMSLKEAETLRELALRWLRLERALEANINALTNEMMRRMLAGETITPSMIRRAERYQILKAQAEREIIKYSNDAAQIIADGQTTALEQGLQTAQDAIVSSTDFEKMFNKINIGAVDSMVGFAGDGSPLVALLLDSFGTEITEKIIDSLVNGVAQGLGADAVARDIAGDLGGSFDRSLVIARTEINRSYRSASTEQYRQSGVVSGFMRLVARDEACLACLALDGERFETADEMDDHPNGRCTCVPIIAGEPLPEWEKAEDWFANQDEEKQLEILGPERMQMFKNGTPFEAFGDKAHSDVWGDSPKIVTIEDLKASGDVPPMEDEFPSFDTASEMSRFGDGYMDGVEFSQEEADAAVFYKAEGYDAINSILRDDADLLEFENIVDNLDNAIQKTSIPENITVFRGTTLDAFEDLNIGDTFTDKGYMSTSLNYSSVFDFAKDNTFVEIEIPAGTHGLFVESIATEARQEWEIILERGSNFIITGIRKEDDGTITYIMRHLND